MTGPIELRNHICGPAHHVDRIYQAAVAPEYWPVFLDGLRAELQLASLHLVFRHPCDGDRGIVASTGMDGFYEDAYRFHYYQLNPWRPFGPEAKEGRALLCDGLLPESEILGTEFSVDVVLTWGAGAYIVGEETALIESLEGNRGMPRLKPPYFPAAVGLYGQPTIVNNVETLANVPWLVLNGAEGYKRYGSESSPGTRMFAVSGHVKRPGVYEVEHGTTTFRELLYGDNYCHGIRDGHELKMFIPGGGSAPWFFEEHLDLPLEARTVGEAGSMLGSGAAIFVGQGRDLTEVGLDVLRFFRNESCGKCVPCRIGTEKAVKLVEASERPPLALLRELHGTLERTSLCGLGQVALAPLLSLLERDDV